MNININIDTMGKRIFAGIILLMIAAALICYSVGIGPVVLGLPLYKIILGVALIGWVFGKIILSRQLRKKFQIAFPVALLFLLFEKEIAVWTNLPDQDIINNWLVIAGAIVLNLALRFIIPKKYVVWNKKNQKQVGSRHAFSSETHYIDAEATKKSWSYNRMGNREIYYQNTDSLDPHIPIELCINNLMGNVEVHIPNEWIVENTMETSMGNTEIRPNGQGPVRLILSGENKMGNVEIVSP